MKERRDKVQLETSLKPLSKTLRGRIPSKYSRWARFFFLPSLFTHLSRNFFFTFVHEIFSNLEETLCLMKKLMFEAAFFISCRNSNFQRFRIRLNASNINSSIWRYQIIHSANVLFVEIVQLKLPLHLT